MHTKHSVVSQLSTTNYQLRSQPTTRAPRRLLRLNRSQTNSMDLDRRRRGEADEYYDAITTGILTDGIDVEIGFPVVNGPNVAGLIDQDACLTHHRDKTGRSVCPIQRLSVVQKHLAA